MRAKFEQLLMYNQFEFNDRSIHVKWIRIVDSKLIIHQ